MLGLPCAFELGLESDSRGVNGMERSGSPSVLDVSGKDEAVVFAAVAFAVFNQGIVERKAFFEEWFVEHGIVLLF